jgi:predicted AAA+ superfamily ATPase
MLERPLALQRLDALFAIFPVAALLGARQVGKSTLARAFASNQPATFFDAEIPPDVAQLDDPWRALAPLRGLVVIDEAQRVPAVFPVLRALVDRPDNAARFLLLGSAAPELWRSMSETLAGRVGSMVLSPFGLHELPDPERLWLRGGFPRSALAESDEASFQWREAFVSTFLERDLAWLGVTTASSTMRRFWTMLAHWHGQRWNGAEFGRNFGVSDKTVRAYLDALTGAYVVRQLQPWHENLASRQVKAPKVYIADSGLLHGLLGLRHAQDLSVSPKVGASWEGFALGEVVAALDARPQECFHWAAHAGPELDLLVVRGNERRGFEFKLHSAPTLTRSMLAAKAALKLDRLQVVAPVDRGWELAEGIEVTPLSGVRA